MKTQLTVSKTQYVIQSEVSQKEENKYPMLIHICGLQKNGTDERIWKLRNRDTEVKNKHRDTKMGTEWNELGD